MSSAAKNSTSTSGRRKNGALLRKRWRQELEQLVRKLAGQRSGECQKEEHPLIYSGGAKDERAAKLVASLKRVTEELATSEAGSRRDTVGHDVVSCGITKKKPCHARHTHQEEAAEYKLEVAANQAVSVCLSLSLPRKRQVQGFGVSDRAKERERDSEPRLTRIELTEPRCDRKQGNRERERERERDREGF